MTFESGNPDFFIAHYGTSGPLSRFGAPPWIEAATRLAHSGVLSIAIVLGANDFDADFVRRVLSFDKQALQTAKSIINHAGLPDPAALQATQDIFFQTFAWEGAKQRAPKLRERGIGQAGDFELNLGRHVGSL